MSENIKELLTPSFDSERAQAFLDRRFAALASLAVTESFEA